MSEDLEKSGLFWYAEDPYLKILQTDAKKLMAVVEAARDALFDGMVVPNLEIADRLNAALKELEGKS